MAPIAAVFAATRRACPRLRRPLSFFYSGLFVALDRLLNFNHYPCNPDIATY